MLVGKETELSPVEILALAVTPPHREPTLTGMCPCLPTSVGPLVFKKRPLPSEIRDLCFTRLKPDLPASDALSMLTTFWSFNTQLWVLRVS